MVVAVGGMQAIPAAVQWAAREADSLGLRLRLVHLECPYTTSEVDPADASALSTELLADAAGRARTVSGASTWSPRTAPTATSIPAPSWTLW